MRVPDARVHAIEAEIRSEESPVGIDARKTHVIIIHMLEEIQERLARLEEAILEQKNRVE